MAPRRHIQVQIITVLILSIVVLSAVAVSYGLGFFQGLDNFFYDLHFKYRGTVANTQEIVLVLMDEKSSGELKRTRGMWSRKHLAKALENLCAAEAEIIGLDMILSAPDSEPTTDIILADTIYQCNNVVLGRDSSGAQDELSSPLPIFQEGMIGDGFLDVLVDRDDVLRKVEYLNAKPLSDGGLMLLPSFSLELARAFLNI